MNEHRRATTRRLVLDRVAELDPTLPAHVAGQAFDAAVTTSRALGVLCRAFEDDPEALLFGAPGVVGRLVHELRARGSVLPEPTCVRCGRRGLSLIATGEGPHCERCRRRQLAAPCTRCGVVKPVYGRTGHGDPLCSVCAPRPKRRCSRCGEVRVIARRAHDGEGELCDSCFKGPVATCGVCGRHRPCQFVAVGRPICASCRPRRTSRCAHCGEQRPACARWPEGPVCEPCYRAALSRRGPCQGCGQLRRLVSPPGPDARRCASCAEVAVLSVCSSCGVEDRLYAGRRCVRCALALRTRALLGDPGGPFEALYETIVSAPQPYSMHNWLRSSGPGAILKELVAGTLSLTHEALDGHPRRRSADHLRHLLVASGLLEGRDEALVDLEGWVARRLGEVADAQHRRVLRSYGTWRVLRRARQRADAAGQPRTPTAHAKNCLNAAIGFLEFIGGRHESLESCTQVDIDAWLVEGPPSAPALRDFLDWTASSKMTGRFDLPTRQQRGGPVTDDETRWALARRLLHDDELEVADRVAGCLVLLYGQQLSRIAALRRDQVARGSDGVTRLHLGTTALEVSPPLDALLQRLMDEHRPRTAFSAPAITSPWLFPGLKPGRPFQASRLGGRLRRLGIEPQAARRSSLLHLAAHLPAPVLARALNLTPHTAVRWVSAAGGDWNRYAAELIRAGDRAT